MSSIVMRLVRSDGIELVTGRESGWILEQDSLDDWIEPSLSVSTSPCVIGDGSSLVSKRVEEKDRTASMFYIGPDENKKSRETALSFFNPKYSFRAYVTNMGTTRWVEGELCAFECKVRNERFPTRVVFTLLCIDPYFRDEKENSQAFGDSSPMFGFPFVSHIRQIMPNGSKNPSGFMPSKTIFDGKNTIWNNGHVETAYKVRIEADGKLINPAITKDSRHVKLLCTMEAGDVAEIDFTAAPPTVELNGQNAIQLASRDSSFTKMKMQVGANTFAFLVDNVENRSLAKVQVIFNKKYMGV